jgi:hypothetical protein
MAENAVPIAKFGNGPGQDPAVEQPEKLDQVRDILFGGQMRMVDARLRGLEERIDLEQTALRNDLTRKIAELQEASEREFTAHAERLATERAKRADELKSLSAEMKEAMKILERRHLNFEEATSQADAEVRDQLMKQSAAFTAELSRTAERLTSELDRAASALRADKVDKTTLAGALTDMAARVSDGATSLGSLTTARAPGKGSGKS